ncbi:glycosyltransferase [Candidatus Shapirobacteria bacterium]|nr:glycosyltransferase [Candidatus Shapirobacteria bacterium]
MAKSAGKFKKVVVMKKFKIALVHDFLIDFGGAERVLCALKEIYPQAPVFVSIYKPELLGEFKNKFKDWEIKTSWFQKIPGAEKLISPFRFLLPLIWESFDFSGFDLVISSSSWAMPKGIITSPETLHLCYCHTPPRYLYGYPTARPWQKYWLVRVYTKLVNGFMKKYDWASSARVDYFIANSKEVQGRIKRFYQRDSIVINPPVEIPKKLKKVKLKKDAPYFFASRLASPKNHDLAVKACGELKRSLLVAGDGPLRGEIEKLVAQYPTVKYLGRITDKKLGELYRQCRAVIFPVIEEDFGIVPLEANAYGKPVIALFSGGAKETVKERETGMFFKKPTVNSLKKAILKFEKKEKSFEPEVMKEWAKGFSKSRFKREIKDFVYSHSRGGL